MPISRLDLMLLLNVHECCDICISEQVDDVCDALTDGTLSAIIDGDVICALCITPVGREYLPPTLPDAAA
jgi:hypothetical protein